MVEGALRERCAVRRAPSTTTLRVAVLLPASGEE
jgi:hypothetical protein